MKSVNGSDVRFLLKDPRADRPTLISLVYRYDNQRFVYSTGQFIEPCQWSTDSQRAYTNQKNRLARQPFETINAHLERHRAALVKIMAGLHMAGVALTNTTLKQRLDTDLGKDRPASLPVVVEQPVESFRAYIVRFVELARSGQRLNAKNKRYASGTLINFLKFGNILADYEQHIGKPMAYADFTLTFYTEFKRWLTAKGLTLNYVGSVLNGVKMLLKQAYDDNLHTNTAFEKKEFRKIEEEVDNIYLTEPELQTLFALNLTHNPRLDRVRDLFLIGCDTGLRFSDYSQLQPGNINGRILTVTTQKTSSRVSIPLTPRVRSILEKYDGVPPVPMSNQKFNDYLKELGQLAGLTGSVERTRTVGGLRTTNTAQKWELLTTHTARRSFATNAFLAGLPTVSIMMITGHKSEGQFLKYIKITSEQNALLLLDHPDFGGTGPQVKNSQARVRPLRKAT